MATDGRRLGGVELHLAEWGCELLGTALMVFAGLSVVVLDFGPASPVAPLIPDHSARLLLTGMLFATTGSVFAITPPGRLSGAHLDPAVTFAFFLTGHVRRLDLLGYCAGQVAGASLGAALVAAAWGARAAGVNYGRTVVAAWLNPVAAVGIEALMTALMIGTIFLFTSRASTARWTPLAVWAVIALLVWQGAPYTGTSLNPARSLGPDLVAGRFDGYWVYVLGPLLGAAGAVAAVKALPAVYPLTAKLFHDPAYRSVFRTALPARG